MKTKKFKRVLTLVLALAMMLSLSMVSFATTDTVTLYVNGVSQGTCDINYTYDPNGENLYVNTVYDILKVKYGTAATWSSNSGANSTYSPLYYNPAPPADPNPLYGKYNFQICYLSSLNGTGSTHHAPAAGALNANDYYISGQTADPALAAADAALSEYGGLYYWYGDGYGFAADWQHMVYIGDDWVFTVNGSRPGEALDPNDPNYEAYEGEFQYTMRESLLKNGDRVDLNYTYFFFVFDTV